MLVLLEPAFNSLHWNSKSLGKKLSAIVDSVDICEGSESSKDDIGFERF